MSPQEYGKWALLPGHTRGAPEALTTATSTPDPLQAEAGPDAEQETDLVTSNLVSWRLAAAQAPLDGALPGFQDRMSNTASAEGVVPREAEPWTPLAAESPRVELPASTLQNPRSAAANFVPQLPVVHEKTALKDLLSFPNMVRDADGFVEFELDDFSVYIDSALNPNELRSLHHLATRKSGHSVMYFDGILSIEGIRRFVKKVPFRQLPIGNYGTSDATVGDQIWILSKGNERKRVYYRLKSPSIEYARFYGPFLWVADLGKHFVDYCGSVIEQDRQVTIHDFRFKFSKWLEKTHKGSPSLQGWLAQLGRQDFRSSIVANVEFIWKETCSILGLEKAKSLHIFQEILHFVHYKPCVSRAKGPIAPTVVTPYIHDCFHEMAIGTLLERIEPPPGIGCEDFKDGWAKRGGPSLSRGAPESSSHDEMVSRIDVGHVISTLPDGEGSGTKWKKQSGEGRWYGLVQRVNVSKRGGRRFDVSWLYGPADTPCGQMKYPWQNELFLSDHCTCDEGQDCNIDEDEVVGIHKVEWMGGPSTTAEFFIRQVYQHKDGRFVTLDPRRLACEHGIRGTCEYQAGDTVLIEGPHTTLEPCEVVSIYGEEGREYACLRRLPRRRDEEADAPTAPVNELIYGGDLVKVRVPAIKDRCTIRYLYAGQKVPAPYDRGGVGNLFFITHQEVMDEGQSRYLPLGSEDQPCFRQGFGPQLSGGKKLRALDLFCGSGSFGRGLEDGGAIEVRWVNDIWDKAVHTYMANAKSPKTVHPFLGSVDDLLRCGLGGEYSSSVPWPREVDFISAGSPCPGFSLLTIDRMTEEQGKNRSLIASFASFIDFYRPKFAVLENVPSIIQTGPSQIEDIFGQLTCALIGMGYQFQIMLGNAWSYGGAQTRSRAFLYIAAPGMRLPDLPRPTHWDPHAVKPLGRWRLGKMSNDEAFVSLQCNEPAAFIFTSAQEATADLPDIGDAKPDICVAFPDHRLCTGISSHRRPQIEHIPTQPYGIGFAKAWNEGRGVMTEAERASYPVGTCRVRRRSKAWLRIHPKGLFSTVTTTCNWCDGWIGRLLHWKQQRPITIMEARRAQGVPDDEVLLGKVAEKWKLVGNAVAREMAVVLGLAFRKAWFGTLYDEGVPQAGEEPTRRGEEGDGEATPAGDADYSISEGAAAFWERSSDSVELITPLTLDPETRVDPDEAVRKRRASQGLTIEPSPKKARRSSPVEDELA